MTSALAYSTATPTVAQRNRDQVAVIAAAARRAREREAREARITGLAARIDRDLTAEAPAATRVGCKVIDEWAKWRPVYSRAAAPAAIARHILDGDDIEYWPLP